MGKYDAAVKLPDGSFLRWEEGMALFDEEKAVPLSEGREAYDKP